MSTDDRKPALGRIQLQTRAVRAEPAARPPDPPAKDGPHDVAPLAIRVELAALGSVPRVVALAHKLLPLRERAAEIDVAMAHPENKKAIDELEFVTGKTVRVQAAPEDPLLATIRAAYDAMERGETYFGSEAADARSPRPKDVEPAKPAKRTLSSPARPAATGNPPARVRASKPPPAANAHPRSGPAPGRRRSSTTMPAASRDKSSSATTRRSVPPRRPQRDLRADDDSEALIPPKPGRPSGRY